MKIESHESQTVERIATLVAEAGGRCFYVGGCVRDALRGESVKDLDVEVHGLKPAELEGVLDQVGERIAVGEAFGIYMLRGHDIDIAMPRREKARGRGHRDFDVFVDPDLGVREAARRRDFTINAMMLDVLSGELQDPFGGEADLEVGVLRHVDERSFGEDPLRVLRGAQFAARFRYEIAEETRRLCAGMELAALPKERILGEVEKALGRSAEPSIFFRQLRRMEQLDLWFPELAALIGVRQDPRFHQEGDVWNHTMMVLDQAARYREETEDPTGFMLAALCHDMGKAICYQEEGDRIHSYGHETEGLPLVRAFLERITGEKARIRYVLNLVELHMKPNGMAHAHSSVKATNRLFDRAVDPAALIYLAVADSKGMCPPADDTALAFLLERLDLYREYMARPYVTGRDLEAAGVRPGPGMGDLLAYAHKLRLAGVPKEEALRQTLGMARSGKGI